MLGWLKRRFNNKRAVRLIGWKRLSKPRIIRKERIRVQTKNIIKMRIILKEIKLKRNMYKYSECTE